MADDPVARLRELEQHAAAPEIDEDLVGSVPADVLLEHVFEALPAMVVLKDTLGRVRRANARALKFTGRSMAEMVGRTTAHFSQHYASASRDEEDEVIRSGKPKLGIVRPYRRWDGQLRWLRLDKIPHHDRTGAVDGVVVFGIDVTDLVGRPPAET
jgi:PAS domain S-box-containing protein